MRKIVLICAIALMTISAKGQQVVEIDLHEAMEIALTENPTIKIANMEIERYDYVKGENRGNLLPTLSASGSYSRSIIAQTLGGSIKMQGDNSFSAGLSLSLPLYAPALYNIMKLTDEQMKGAVETARSSKITLINDVKKSFYGILLAERSLEVLKASEKTLTDVVSNVQTMYNNGLVAEYDLITAEVQQSNLRPTIIQTENSINVAKAMLKMYLSIPEEYDIILKGSLDDYKDTNISGIELSRDISENTTLRSLDIQNDILKRQLKLLRSQRQPMLAAFANFQLSGTDMPKLDFGSTMMEPFNGMIQMINGVIVNTGQAVPGFIMNPYPLMNTAPAAPSKYKYQWQRPLSAGISLSVPIFAGGTKTYKEKQLKNSIRQFEAQKEYAAEGVYVQMENAINGVITNSEQIAANEKTIQKAQKALQIAQSRYNAGAGTILELNNAELTLTQSKLSYTQAVYNYLSAVADYDKIVGIEK